MSAVELTLYAKPGCHLCDDARDIIQAVVKEPGGPAVTVTEVSILDDPALQAKYGEEIPVVLIDGTMHSYWTVDAGRLRTALAKAAR